MSHLPLPSFLFLARDPPQRVLNVSSNKAYLHLRDHKIDLSSYAIPQCVVALFLHQSHNQRHLCQFFEKYSRLNMDSYTSQTGRTTKPRKLYSLLYIATELDHRRMETEALTELTTLNNKKWEEFRKSLLFPINHLQLHKHVDYR